MLEPLRRAGKRAVIPSRAKRLNPRTHDKERYKARHLIENFFAKLKHFRAIATRYDKSNKTSSPQFNAHAHIFGSLEDTP